MASAVLAGGTASASDEAASAVNTLGLDLLREAFPKGNAVLSPYSIQLALAMAYGGAAGRTVEDMRRTLHYPKSEALLHDSFAELQNDVMGVLARAERARRSGAGRADAEPMTLLVANRLFAQRGLPIKEPFLELLKVFYGAPVELMNFASNPAGSEEAINAWFANQTRQLMQNVVPAGTIDSDTRIVLANAVYFKGDWQESFSETWTLPRAFYLEPGRPVDVPTMKIKSRLFGYEEIPGATIVTVPFVGGELQLVLIVPDPRKTLADVERKLTPASLAQAAHARARPVILLLPKFRAAPESTDLMPHLSMLARRAGASAHFTNFSRITDAERIVLAQVFHKARMAIDEHGAVAAAATAVVMGGISLRAPEPEPKIVKVNRPFLFGVQHRRSGACLFLGRVTDPR